MGLKEVVLVTGVAGFLGSSAAKALSSQYRIVGLDNYSTGKPSNVPPCVEVMHEGDICNPQHITQVFRTSPISYVIHCAAQRDIRVSKDLPILDATSNIIGSLNLMEACVKYKVKKLIYTNSGGAGYGETNILPTPETEPFVSECHYGVSKTTVERYLQVYEKLYNLPYVSFRLANMYGVGQTSSGEAGVVAVFTEKLFRGEHCSLFGEGKTRDYVNVLDLMSAFQSALEEDFTGNYNVGTGRQVPDHLIYTLIHKEVTKYKNLPNKFNHPRLENKRPGEVQHSALLASKATQTFGWLPKVSIEEGVEQFVSWYYTNCVCK